MSEIITKEDAAKKVGLPTYAVSMLENFYQIPRVPVGKRFMYDDAALEKLKEAKAAYEEKRGKPFKTYNKSKPKPAKKTKGG